MITIDSTILIKLFLTMLVSKVLRGNKLLKHLVYSPLKNLARSKLGSFRYILYYLDHNREVKEDLLETFGDGKLGILKDPFHFHEPYAKACLEFGVGYKMVDIFASDWIERIKTSGCEMFMVWPAESIVEWKKLFDDRLRFIVEQLGKKIYPDLTATWIYGSKERQAAWLEINGFPHPKTWVIYDESEALKFNQFPVVAKTDIGAIASGVKILRSKCDIEKYVKFAFNRGVQGYYADKQARQWRHVLFQEYLGEGVKEWRVHRLGDSFFGFGKSKVGKFHSGSGKFDYSMPPHEALELAWQITEKGKFRSMAVDIFETADGKFYVNELQCIFGQHSSKILYKDGITGRLLRKGDDWEFEPGEFAINHGCTLRVKDAIKMLEMR